MRTFTEVIDMFLEDGEPALETEFIGTQLVADVSPILLRQIAHNIGLTVDDLLRRR